MELIGCMLLYLAQYTLIEPKQKVHSYSYFFFKYTDIKCLDRKKYLLFQPVLFCEKLVQPDNKQSYRKLHSLALEI